MKEISDIYKITYRCDAEFRGTLRNERRFKYGQKVFIGYGYGERIKLYPAVIKGVSDDKDLSNPSYIYEVQVPNWVVEKELKEIHDMYSENLSEIPFYKWKLKRDIKRQRDRFANEDNIKYRNLKCDRIFTSIDEAKESVLKNLESVTSLNRDNLERYFKRFDNDCKFISEDE